MEQLLKDGQYIEFFLGELALHCGLPCPPSLPTACTVSPPLFPLFPSSPLPCPLQRGLALVLASPSIPKEGSFQYWWTLLWKVGGAGCSWRWGRELEVEQGAVMLDEIRTPPQAPFQTSTSSLWMCHTTRCVECAGVECAGVVCAGVVCWCGVCWCGVCWCGVCWYGVCWYGVCWCGVCWCRVC